MRAHNQYAAEQTYGAGFMLAKREAARRRPVPDAREVAGGVATTEAAPAAEAAAVAGAAAAAAATAAVAAMVEARARAEEVAPYLRALGFRVDEVRDAVGYCETLNGGSPEERVKAAIRYLRPKKT